MDYISTYWSLKDKGYEDLEAFGLVANEIARNGTMSDLRAVADVYNEDFKNDCEQLFMEVQGCNIQQLLSWKETVI